LLSNSFKIALILITISVSPCLGQTNLVPNGDFEQIVKTTEGHAYLDNIKFWFNPSGNNNELNFGTPDHLFIPPDKKSKWVKPLSGSSAVGLITYLKRVSNYREYLSVALKEPLLPGKTYALSFYISAGNEEVFANIPTSNLGVLFTTSMFQQNGFAPISATPSFVFDSLFHATQWKKVSYQFKADLPYRFLTIGNFSDDATTFKSEAKRSVDPQSYLLIDDVSLTELPPPLIEESSSNQNYSSQEKPVTIDAKNINIQHRIVTNSGKLTIKIWDDKNVDGDIITLLINNKVLLRNYKLDKRKKKLKIVLPHGTLSNLVMIAENLGTSPPNTAAIKIISGKKKELFQLKSDLENSGGISINVK